MGFRIRTRRTVCFWLAAMLASAAIVAEPAMMAPALAAGAGAAAALPLPPSVAFGQLYRDVELRHLFSDSKTFADMIPLQPASVIMQAYAQQADQPGFDLKAFVGAHFQAPVRKEVSYKPGADRSVQTYIHQMWDILKREPDEAGTEGSLLPLPHAYIVPGGRFSEIYYWDSYFSMLGLEQDGRHAMVIDMVENMASLIDRYGHIPNGNRSYYLSRSQPPIFAGMVDLLAKRDDGRSYVTYLPELRQEYDYWMDGEDELANGQAHRHLVRLQNGVLMNRFWDDLATPRDESYAEDVETAQRSGRDPGELWRNLRAGGETGWDFSSRWLADPHDLATIRTVDVLPVDLNTLMAHLERTLSHAYQLAGRQQEADRFARRAESREAAIRTLMWDQQRGLFTDYLWRQGQKSDAISSAMAFPLLFGIATDEQAKATAEALRTHLLTQSGLLATTIDSGQQWDKPNGWAPLQWVAVQGLRRYGQDELARTIATRWIRKNVNAYEGAGVLVEKYDLLTNPKAGASGGGGGGEYPLQVGFGWTNGVLASLRADYPDALPAHGPGAAALAK